MIYLYSATLLVGACLLFLVEPMMGKMILPFLGGAPTVWNTCLVFFQAALLAGYAYAHFSTRWLGVRRQAVLHLGLLMLPFLVLPVGISDQIIRRLPTTGNPTAWLVVCLAISVGLPFFVVATTAPLLQQWFASMGQGRARHAYSLYAASNAGSMLGLFGYVLLWEPTFLLKQQAWLWTLMYGAFAVLMIGCAIALWRSKASDAATLEIGEHGLQNQPSDSTSSRTTTLTFTRRLRWLFLAALPSSLMLGVTTYLTTDVAPIPLFWVIPLMLYLLTFILVFARRPVYPAPWMRRVLCLPAVVLTIAFVAEVTEPAWLFILLHLLVFFIAAMICHAELAKDRPPAKEYLTEFYLYMSLGGVLGGLFNVLVAPLIFRTVLEYPLAIILACSIRPTTAATPRAELRHGNDLLWALGIGALTAALIATTRVLGIKLAKLPALWIFGVPAVLSYRFVKRPVRFSLCLGAMFVVASAGYVGTHGRVLWTGRNFFGVLRVTEDVEGKYHQLVHGNTLHGRQSLDPAHQAEPLAYYHPSGPIGQVFEMFQARVGETPANVAVVGLGAGSLASYARPSQEWTFYEIDPAVEQIARDTQYFTFLKLSPAKTLQVVLGDARLRLKEAPDHQYNMIVTDAFSSDSIPVHLITREAFHLYLAKLTENGILAFHISNRRLDLEPVIANLAQDAGLVAFCRMDLSGGHSGKEASDWVVMAHQLDDLKPLPADRRWHILTSRSGAKVWTDDFSNIISVLKWQ